MMLHPVTRCLVSLMRAVRVGWHNEGLRLRRGRPAVPLFPPSGFDRAERTMPFRLAPSSLHPLSSVLVTHSQRAALRLAMAVGSRRFQPLHGGPPRGSDGEEHKRAVGRQPQQTQRIDANEQRGKWKHSEWDLRWRVPGPTDPILSLRRRCAAAISGRLFAAPVANDLTAC
jgi:hypothetical protein